MTDADKTLYPPDIFPYETRAGERVARIGPTTVDRIWNPFAHSTRPRPGIGAVVAMSAASAHATDAFQYQAAGIMAAVDGAYVKPLAAKFTAIKAAPDLRGANLRGADLQGADLTGALLAVADLRGANLRDANLRDANLLGADGRDADLAGADIRGANLINAKFGFTSFYRANLEGADLTGANLTGADLREADIQGANLESVYLQGADLTHAILGDWERGPDGYARRIAKETP